MASFKVSTAVMLDGGLKGQGSSALHARFVSCWQL